MTPAVVRNFTFECIDSSMVFPLHIYKKAATTIFFFLLSICASCQQSDTTKGNVNFSGAASITNNGFSLIPAFSLGKPAAMVVLNMGGKRLTFEPEFRYSLKGNPWSFIFIWRYKIIKKEKFHLSLGTHFPALNFVTGNATINGVDQETIRARQFFPVAEVHPNYFINKTISVGVYYQYGRTQAKELARNTHFVSLRPFFSNIRLPKNFYLRFNPQFYYLKMDRRDGFYTASSLALGKRNFPVSISSLMNKVVDTEIPGNNFDWNISVVYSFNRGLAPL